MVSNPSRPGMKRSVMSRWAWRSLIERSACPPSAAVSTSYPAPLRASTTTIRLPDSDLEDGKLSKPDTLTPEGESTKVRAWNIGKSPYVPRSGDPRRHGRHGGEDLSGRRRHRGRQGRGARAGAERQAHHRRE